MVTSISVLTDDDPEIVRRKYERDYKKYSVEAMQATVTQPKFKFYLYNEEGDLVQEELSIHDIQHFFLHAAYNVDNSNNILDNFDNFQKVSVGDKDDSSSGNSFLVDTINQGEGTK